MHTKWLPVAVLFAAALMALLPISYSISWAEETSGSSAVLTLLNKYGDTAHLDVPDPFGITLTETMETEQILVTLREIVYDGVRLYTAVDISSLSPESVMVMPADTDSRNPISKDDPRSFLEAARTEGKRLLAVHAYPRELDDLESCFRTHLEPKNDVFTLISSGCLNTGNEPAQITWNIQVYEVHPDTGKRTLLTALESKPRQVYPLTPVETREYAVQEENAPFDSLRLVKTNLAMYAYPLKNGEAWKNYDWQCYTAEGERIPNSTTLDMRALNLSEFPARFILKHNHTVSYHLSIVPE